MRPVTSAVSRFWQFVQKTEGCWLWVGSIKETGYGQIAERIDSRWVPVRVHRVSWEIHNGPIPAGKKVLHRCDVRNCVNPNHLFLGSQRENLQDALWKGRAPGAKLTPHDAKYIRLLYARGDMTQAAIGKRFGVGRTVILSIAKNYTWVPLE